MMMELSEELQAEYPWVDSLDDPEVLRWHPSELRNYYENDGEKLPKYNGTETVRTYNEWILQEPVRTGPTQPPHMVKLRIFCFPQAGMGAWAFHDWVRRLPLWVEVMPLEFPGRNSRTHQPAVSNCTDLGRQAAFGLKEQLEEKPYVVIGHSMGSWVCHEFVREVLRAGTRPPLKMYFSGTRAPHLAGCDNDVDRIAPSLHVLDKDEFWTQFERRYNKNPDLEDDFIKEYIYNTLKSDFKSLETFAPKDVSPIAIPLTAMGANGDNRYSREQISAWESVTSAQFEERWFDGKQDPEYWGNAHRYMVDNADELLAFLSEDLGRLAL